MGDSAPSPLPKSIIRSQFSPVLPKSASKSMVIPSLNKLVLISGKSMYGPPVFVPPGKFQAPLAPSISNPETEEFCLVALLPRPERSRTAVSEPNEFRSDEL